jgi:ubiquinone/menaquinone biosynthesis C-methylase UbiE
MTGQHGRRFWPAESALLDPARIASCFDRSSNAYDEIVWRNRQGAERLVAALPAEGYRDVLDVGCGTGLASLALTQRFEPRSITGVDLSQEMLERFRARLPAFSGVLVNLHQADVLAMPVTEESFDLVLSTMAFHWFPDRLSALRAMARALRAGGVLGLLAGARGSDEEYRRLLLSLCPPAPAPLIEIYERGVSDVGELEWALGRAGLEPIDVWIERRRRRSPPDRFMARARAVTGHLIADREPEEQATTWARITAAVVAASEPAGFVYHFNKIFAVARKPAL